MGSKIGLKWYGIAMVVSAIGLAHMIVTTWDEIFLMINIGPTGIEGELFRQGILTFALGFYLVWLVFYTLDINTRRQGQLLFLSTVVLAILVYVFRESTPINLYTTNFITFLIGSVFAVFLSDLYGGLGNVDLRRSFEKSRQVSNDRRLFKIFVCDENNHPVNFSAATYALLVPIIIVATGWLGVSLYVRGHHTATDWATSGVYIATTIIFLISIVGFIRFNTSNYGSNTKIIAIGPKGSGKTYFALGCYLSVLESNEYKFLGLDNDDELMEGITTEYRDIRENAQEHIQNDKPENTLCFEWFLKSTLKSRTVTDEEDGRPSGRISFSFRKLNSFDQPTFSINMLDHAGEILEGVANKIDEKTVMADGGRRKEWDQSVSVDEVPDEFTSEIRESISKVASGPDLYRTYDQLGQLESLLHGETSMNFDSAEVEIIASKLEEVEDNRYAGAITDFLADEVGMEKENVRERIIRDYEEEIDSVAHSFEQDHDVSEFSLEKIGEIIDLIRFPDNKNRDSNDFDDVRTLALQITEDDVLTSADKRVLITNFKDKLETVMYEDTSVTEILIEMRKLLVEIPKNYDPLQSIENLQTAKKVLHSILIEDSLNDSEVERNGWSELRDIIGLAEQIEDLDQDEKESIYDDFAQLIDDNVEELRAHSRHTIRQEAKLQIQNALEESDYNSIADLFEYCKGDEKFADSKFNVDHEGIQDVGDAINLFIEKDTLDGGEKTMTYTAEDIHKTLIETLRQQEHSLKQDIRKEIEEELKSTGNLEEKFATINDMIDSPTGRTQNTLGAMIYLAQIAGIDLDELSDRVDKAAERVDTLAEKQQDDLSHDADTDTRQERENDPQQTAINELKEEIEVADTIIMLIDSQRVYGGSPTLADKGMEINNLRRIAQNTSGKDIILVASKADYFIEEFEQYIRNERNSDTLNVKPAGEHYHEFRTFVTNELASKVPNLVAKKAADANTIYPVWFDTRTDCDKVITLEEDTDKENKQEDADEENKRYPSVDEDGEMKAQKFDEVIERIVE